MARRVEGSVLRIRCKRCGEEHFDVRFSGDTDMATEGLVAATSVGYAVVGVREAGDDEWGALCHGDTTLAEAAFQRAFGGPGWQVPRVLRWEDDAGRQPRPVYACLACAVGEGEVAEEVDARTFEQRGGRLLTGDGLTIGR